MNTIPVNTPRLSIAPGLKVAESNLCRGCRCIAQAIITFRYQHGSWSDSETLKALEVEFEELAEDPSTDADAVDEWLSELYDWADFSGVRILTTL